jgi:hypothetical protein
MKRSNPQSPPTISKNMYMLEQTHVRQGSREEYRGSDRERAARARVVAYLERLEYAYEH